MGTSNFHTGVALCDGRNKKGVEIYTPNRFMLQKPEVSMSHLARMQTSPFTMIAFWIVAGAFITTFVE